MGCNVMASGVSLGARGETKAAWLPAVGKVLKEGCAVASPHCPAAGRAAPAPASAGSGLGALLKGEQH